MGWHSVSDRADEHAEHLPRPPKPQGLYVPAVVYGGVAYSAGMTPRIDGVLPLQGVVGEDVPAEQARVLAARAAANALAAVADAVGGLDNVIRCLQMTVYIAAAVGFAGHSAIADGASEALRTQLREHGEVARSAVGVSSLPSGAPVEVSLTVAVREALT